LKSYLKGKGVAAKDINDQLHAVQAVHLELAVLIVSDVKKFGSEGQENGGCFDY